MDRLLCLVGGVALPHGRDEAYDFVAAAEALIMKEDGPTVVTEPELNPRGGG
jgi:hypothetical protein